MNKRFVLLLISAAALLSLAIGISAAHSGRIVFAKGARPHPAAKAKAAPATRIPSASQDDSMRVIRFASNPEEAPPFLLVDLDGHPVSTAMWQGKVVILNFWATWCGPCREEIPEMIDLASRYKDRVQIVGASVDDISPAEVNEFAKRMGINYPVVMAGLDLVSEYGGVPALPTSFVIDTHGRVVQKHVGLYPTDVYESEIRSLLGLPVNGTVETFKDTGQIFLKNAALATELPDVNLKGLNAEQKRIALKEMNSRNCNCGCELTIAQCRVNDTACPISKQLAAEIVKKVLEQQTAPTAAAAPPASNQ
jgi:thiol-disulfide isomerase/thioredoxin